MGEARGQAHGLADHLIDRDTLAASLALLFWPGTAGEFMKFLPITLLATLTASLVIALIFVPDFDAFDGPTASAPARRAGSDPEPVGAHAVEVTGGVNQGAGPWLPT